MDQVLIIVGDATETVDTLYPYYRLIEGGYKPVVAAPEKRRYQMVMHEVKPGWTITKEWEGYTIQADKGHVTITVDRRSRQLVGAAMACPDASAAIHECVVAIKARVSIDVLADTIHAFPSTSRILNGLFAEALEELDASA